METKKQEAEKRLARENRSLKSEISEIKSKLYEQTTVKAKICDREECISAHRQKNQLKKKKEQVQKEFKKLKDEVDNFARQSQIKDEELSRIKEELAQTKYKISQSNMVDSHLSSGNNNRKISEKKEEKKPVEKKKKQVD